MSGCIGRRKLSKKKKKEPLNKSGLMGGSRDGAGRPQELVSPARLVANVDGHLVKYLEKVQRFRGMGSRSAALRYLLEQCKAQGLGFET